MPRVSSKVKWKGRFCLLLFAAGFIGTAGARRLNAGGETRGELRADLPAFSLRLPSNGTPAVSISAKEFLPPMEIPSYQALLPRPHLIELPRLREARKDSFFTASLVSLAALNTADFFITRKALRRPGNREGNPILRPLADNPWTFSAVKLGLAAASHLLLRELHWKNRTLARALSVAGNLVLAYVVAHNLGTIRGPEVK